MRLEQKKIENTISNAMRHGFYWILGLMLTTVIACHFFLRPSTSCIKKTERSSTPDLLLCGIDRNLSSIAKGQHVKKFLDVRATQNLWLSQTVVVAVRGALRVRGNGPSRAQRLHAGEGAALRDRGALGAAARPGPHGGGAAGGGAQLSAAPKAWIEGRVWLFLSCFSAF